MELPLLIFSKTNIDSSPGHSGTCSALPHRQHQQGKTVLKQQTASVRDTQPGLCLVGRLTRLPLTAKGSLTPNSFRTERRKESDINYKLNQVSLFLNIKSEG